MIRLFMHRRGLSLLLLTLACQQPSERFAWVEQDKATPAPTPVSADPSASRREVETQPATTTTECGRGSGRTPSGQCVPLRTRDLGHVQQVHIPSGIFMMGDVPDSYRARPEEPAVIRWSGQPPRKVEVDGFWIDLHEVTRQAYEACVAAGKCTVAMCSDVDPVADVDPQRVGTYPQTCVTHQQAQAFCQSHGARLPTAAEWEYAARGLDGRKYPWGHTLRDEITGDLVPTTLRLESSYFGILGLGSSALEWVADEYDPEATLAAFQPRPFREAKGPLETTRRAFELRLACGGPPRQGCKALPTPVRHVLKGGRIGATMAGRAADPPRPHLDQELEGWPLASRHPRWGFRCAANLGPEDEILTVPDMPSSEPVLPIRDVPGGQLFTGVAEAVSRSEAQRFCAGLQVLVGRQTIDDWTLPTFEQVRAMGPTDFVGPGPFWLRDGAASQALGSTPADPGLWQAVEHLPDAPLLATCFRAVSSPTP